MVPVVASAKEENLDKVQITTTTVAPGVYMLHAPLTPKIKAAVAALSDKPIEEALTGRPVAFRDCVTP